ncbi:uncharacterized protein [Argopecten irradians]|uniref:uncharacterized protein n=1 Tax=Argopecten irradians TaxID=31199 RepID=UPI00371AE6AF
MDSSVQEPQINNPSTAFLDHLHVAVYIKEDDSHERKVTLNYEESVQTAETNTMNMDTPRDRLAVYVERGNMRKVIFKDEMKLSETGNAETPIEDQFHWSRPNTDEKTTNQLEFKTDISQQVGFLAKQPSFSKTLAPPNETSAQARFVIQSSTRTNHTTDPGPGIKPLGVNHEKKPSTLIKQDEDDFDYSLDLMDDSILKIRDTSKKPTPLLLKAGSNNALALLSNTDTTQTDQSGQANMSPNKDPLNKQFVSDIDLSDLLDTLPVLEEEDFDRIVNRRRGYIFITYSKYRGIKRKIAFDYYDVEYVSPRKTSRMH